MRILVPRRVWRAIPLALLVLISIFASACSSYTPSPTPIRDTPVSVLVRQAGGQTFCEEFRSINTYTAFATTSLTFGGDFNPVGSKAQWVERYTSYANSYRAESIFMAAAARKAPTVELARLLAKNSQEWMSVSEAARGAAQEIASHKYSSATELVRAVSTYNSPFSVALIPATHTLSAIRPLVFKACPGLKR